MINLKEYFPDLLVMDEFKDALVGVVMRNGTEATCYDYKKIIEILKTDGMSMEDAIEHIEFNILGAWVGDHTPFLIFYE